MPSFRVMNGALIAIAMASLGTAGAFGCGHVESDVSAVSGDSGADDAASESLDARADEEAPGSCTFTNRQCVGAPKCCPALTGRRIDVAAGCVDNEPVPIGCVTHEDECAYADGFDCYAISIDGGTELFLTAFQWVYGYVPNATRCDEKQWQAVEVARQQSCAQK
jgi:hypothetical protein